MHVSLTNQNLYTMKAKNIFVFALLLSCNGIATAQIPVYPDLGSSRSLPEDYYGLNGTNTIQDAQGWNTLDDYPNDKNLITVGKMSIRYPGGNVSNYYDWRTG